MIIPTFNRVDEIEELLLSLNKQVIEFSKFEIVVVDDGSTDNTETLIHSFRAESKLQIKFFKQDHRGPGEARNLGMQKSEGEFLLFIDSDCIADQNWLSAYETAILKFDPIGFGGPDKVLPNFSPLQKAIDYSMTSFITTGGIRGHSKKKISKYYPRSFNMGVRADVVQKIGGMNKLRHGQDIEFSNRILNTGGKVIKVDDAVVYHKRRMSIKKFFKQVNNWGIARINLYKIDKKMLEAVHFFPALGTIISFITIVLAIIFPNIFGWFILAGLAALLLMSAHSIIKYKDVRVFFFVPIVVPTQIFGYGVGFIFAFIKRVVFGKSEFTGFTRNYYK